jgi:hypothetical protein
MKINADDVITGNEVTRAAKEITATMVSKVIVVTLQRQCI